MLYNQKMIVEIKGNILHISGSITQSFKDAVLYAANPIDTMSNYSGSALPFPCEGIAMENTVNKKIINGGDGNNYTAKFIYPNSYYDNDGRTLIPPTIYLKVDGRIVEKTELANPFPLKTLNYQREFYNQRERYFGYRYGVLGIEPQHERIYKYKQLKQQEKVV